MGEVERPDIPVLSEAEVVRRLRERMADLPQRIEDLCKAGRVGDAVLLEPFTY